jgi:hypothetical protein
MAFYQLGLTLNNSACIMVNEPLSRREKLGSYLQQTPNRSHLNPKPVYLIDAAEALR